MGVIIAPRMNGRIEGEIPFKAPTHTRCSVAITYVNKGDGRLWNHNFSFNLYCNISCFAVKGSDVIVSLDLVCIVISHLPSYEE